MSETTRATALDLICQRRASMDGADWRSYTQALLGSLTVEAPDAVVAAVRYADAIATPTQDPTP